MASNLVTVEVELVAVVENSLTLRDEALMVFVFRDFETRSVTRVSACIAEVEEPCEP